MQTTATGAPRPNSSLFSEPSEVPRRRPGLHAVTGAFGYSGRAITARLLAGGTAVRCLTGHPGRPDPFGGRVPVAAVDFADPRTLARALEGVEVLFNTFWVRFPRGRATHEAAVAASAGLFRAAREAGVRRIVHVSITRPSADSPLSYFRGKAAVEAALAASGVPHAILRPAVLFGEGDVLLNNIAWVARRFPVIGIPAGDYGVRPIHVGDFARLAVEESRGTGNSVVDAVGPEAPSYADLVLQVARAVGRRPRLVRLPRRAVHAAAAILGLFTGDVVLTAEEVDGLADNLLVTDAPAAGETRLSTWLAENGADLGRTWASELRRHYR